MTGIATTNVTEMQGLYEAFGRGDIPTVIAAMDDRIEWHATEGHPWSVGRPFVGPQEVVEGIFQRLEEFEGFEVRPTRFVADGDTVIMEGRYRAQSHRATGRPLDAEAVHVWDLRNGKITRFHEYVDTRKLADVMGAGR